MVGKQPHRITPREFQGLGEPDELQFEYRQSRDLDTTGLDIHGLGMGSLMIRPMVAVDSVTLTPVSPPADATTITVEAQQQIPQADNAPWDYFEDKPMEPNPAAERPEASASFTDPRRFSTVVTAIEPSRQAIWGTAESGEPDRWVVSFNRVLFAGYDLNEVGDLGSLVSRSIQIHDPEDGHPRHFRPEHYSSFRFYPHQLPHSWVWD